MALFKKEASETNTATLDPQTPNQESPSKDLASIILRKEGKGGGFYLTPDHGITFTTIGIIQKKLHDRAQAGRAVKDLEDLLLNYFPIQLVNDLEKNEITLTQAYNFMAKKGQTKVSNYSKNMSNPERLARILATVAGHKSPEELTEELLGLITDHRIEAEKILKGWAMSHGRSKKGSFILVNPEKKAKVTK